MRFIVDAQLPPALARALSKDGYKADHVSRLKLGSAPDRNIWKHAHQLGVAIITKDEDFAELRAASDSGPVVVWLRVGNTANDFLIPWLIPLMPQVVSAIEAGDVLIELR